MVYTGQSTAEGVRLSVRLCQHDLGSAPPKSFLHKPVCLLCTVIDAVPLGQYPKGCSDSKLQKSSRPVYIECLCAKHLALILLEIRCMSW